MPIIGTDHTSFSVINMEESLAFYRDLLGFEVLDLRPQATNQYLRDIVGLPDAVINKAYLRIPGSEHRLELFEYTQPRGTPQNLTPNNPGSSHIAYLVDNLAELYEKLKAAGATFITPPVYLNEGPNIGGWALYMKDPNGIIIELFQPPQGR